MLFLLAVALLMQAPQTRAAPQDSVLLEKRVSDVSAVLRCPVCQGLSIEDSPSELSLQMKDVVRQQLREGKTPEEVKAYFVSKYGEWILLEPKAAGANLIVYLLPIVLLLGGAIVIGLAVKKWSKPGTTASSTVDEDEEVAV
jgi:cytochrome c-type biogenesis protein CcmH